MILKKAMKEVGDCNFPLEVNLENISYTHEDVGKKAKISPIAADGLCKHRGKRVLIKGVVMKYDRPVAYVVSINGQEFFPLKKDILIDNNVLEDIATHSSYALKVREILAHWRIPKDYHQDSWDGLESLYFELAKVTDFVAFDIQDVRKYESSKRPDMDSRSWRVYLKGTRDIVCVDLHSNFHGVSWSLQTYVFSTREVKEKSLEWIGHKDHWKRVLLWLRETCLLFGLEKDALKFEKRLKANRFLWQQALEVFRCAKGRLDLKPLPPMSIGFSTLRMSPKAAGVHEPPSDERDYSILTIHPNSARDKKYLKQVVLHEMIHFLLGRYCVHEKHGKIFQRLSEKLGLRSSLRK